MKNIIAAALYGTLALAVAIIAAVSVPTHAQFTPPGFPGASCSAPNFLRSITSTGAATCASAPAAFPGASCSAPDFMRAVTAGGVATCVPALTGIAIGDAIGSAGANRIFHADASGNLDDTANFDITTARVRFPVPVLTGGTAPTMGACGTSPSVVGNDNSMLVTIGGGGVATSCAVAFSQSYANAPACFAQSDTDFIAYKMATTVSGATFSSTAAFTAAANVHVICLPRA